MQELIDFINRLDRSILNGIQEVFHSAFLDKAMPIITSMGNGGVIWIIIALGLIFTKKYRKAGIIALMALIITSFFGEVLIKNFVRRSRPFLEIESLKLLITAPTSYSFPSGHTGSSFAVASALAASIKGYGKFFLILALLIAFSRLYLYVHFPSDILGGIILGVLSFMLAEFLYDRITKSKNEKTSL